MSEGVDEVPESPPGEEGKPDTTGAAGDEHADDVDHAAAKIEDITRRVSKHQSVLYPTPSDADVIDIDRTALEAILDVSSRLQDIQKRSKVSMSTLAFAQESYKDKQVNSFK